MNTSKNWSYSHRGREFVQGKAHEIAREVLGRRGPKGAARVIGIPERAVVELAAGLLPTKKNATKVRRFLLNYQGPPDPVESTEECTGDPAGDMRDAPDAEWERVIHRKSQEQVMFPEDWSDQAK